MANVIDGATLERLLSLPDPPLVFDCSLFFGAGGIAAAKQSYEESHIPSAMHLELGVDLSVAGAAFANTRETDPAVLSASLGRLGICSAAARLVLYGRGAAAPAAGGSSSIAEVSPRPIVKLLHWV